MALEEILTLPITMEVSPVIMNQPNSLIFVGFLVKMVQLQLIFRILRSSTEDSNLSILRLSDTTPMAQVGIAILRIFQSLSFRVGSGGMTNDSPFLNSTQKFITSLRKNEYKEGDKKGRTGINKSIDGFSSYR